VDLSVSGLGNEGAGRFSEERPTKPQEGGMGGRLGTLESVTGGKRNRCEQRKRGIKKTKGVVKKPRGGQRAKKKKGTE